MAKIIGDINHWFNFAALQPEEVHEPISPEIIKLTLNMYKPG